MLISGFTTLLAIAVVIGVIGYRFFRSDGSAPAAEVTAMLPKGANHRHGGGRRPHRGDDRFGSGIEIRTFDAKTLKPTGRLRFATEP